MHITNLVTMKFQNEHEQHSTSELKLNNNYDKWRSGTHTKHVTSTHDTGRGLSLRGAVAACDTKAMTGDHESAWHTCWVMDPENGAAGMQHARPTLLYNTGVLKVHHLDAKVNSHTHERTYLTTMKNQIEQDQHELELNILVGVFSTFFLHIKYSTSACWDNFNGFACDCTTASITLNESFPSNPDLKRYHIIVCTLFSKHAMLNNAISERHMLIYKGVQGKAKTNTLLTRYWS